jgi:hypothetical protein
MEYELRSRMRSLRPSLLVLFSLLPAALDVAQTGIIARLPETSRAEMIGTAQTFAGHSWTCQERNTHASCSKNYVSDWKPGQHVTGVPYNWGGADSPEIFDQKLSKGLAAGAHSRNGILSCSAGIDCSGFVSFCWGLHSHAYSTRTLRQIAGKPKYNWFTDMKPGDALVKPGSHVILFDSYNPDGTLNIFEASGSAARVIYHRTTWSRFRGYYPLQYKAVADE